MAGRILNLLIMVFSIIGRYIPRSLLKFFSKCAAIFIYYFDRKDVRAIKKNLRTLYGGEKAEASINLIARRIFFNFSFYFCDMFHFLGSPTGKMRKLIGEFQGENYIHDALKEGKGAIFVTAHLGNWEMGGIFLADHKLEFNVLYRADSFSEIEKRRSISRMKHGVKEIRIGDSLWSVLPVIRVLERNEIVAIQGDRIYGDRSVTVNFAGKKVRFPSGAAEIARISQAPLLPTFVLFDKNRRYNMTVLPPVYVSRTSDRNKDIREAVQTFVDLLEDLIKKHPDQWYCFTDYFDEDG